MGEHRELNFSPRSRLAIIAAGALLTWLMAIGMVIGLAGAALLILY